MMPMGWYAAYTRHQHEKSAAQILIHSGIEVLLPLYQAAHKWKDRTQVVCLPVFPCYLFVRASLESRVQVLRTPGVVQFVGVAKQPSLVPDLQIEYIRRAAESVGGLQPHPYLHSGDQVLVKRGPLAGVEGILTRFKGQYRVVLSVHLLQQSVAVEVDLTDLERIARRKTAA